MIDTATALERVRQFVRSPHMGNDELMPILQTRYELLYETMSWASKRRECIISLVAQVTSGDSDTVTVANGSATVTSAGTPFTSAMTGRMMAIDGEVAPFFITFVSSSVVTLQDGEGTAVLWPRDNASGATWRIFQTLYSLPSTATDLLRLGTDYPLEEIDGGLDALNRFDTNRESTSSDPTHWCYAGTSTDAVPVRQIEVWPVPTTGRILKGEYHRHAPILTLATLIDIHPTLIIYGTVADAYGVLFAMTGDAPYREANIFWERKTTEVMNDIGPRELQRLGLPRTFGMRPRTGPRGDYLTTHIPVEEYP